MGVNEKIRELAGKGFSDHEIAEALTAAGFKNRKGKPFNEEAVRVRRYRAWIPTASTSSEAFTTPDECGIPEGTKPLPQEWKSQILQIVREELQRIMEPQILQKLPTAGPELPPMPEEKVTGKKVRPVNPCKRVKIAGTVDKELDRLFEEWRTEKGMTLSRALDTALWHFLGTPPLSFEIPKTSEEPTDE